MGLFSSGGIGSANTYARLATEKNTRDIAKTLKEQAASAQNDAARVQWCIDRIEELNAEVTRLRREVDRLSQPPS